MTYTQIEEFINDNIIGKNINQTEEELKTLFCIVDCYEEDIYEEEKKNMVKGYNCMTDENEDFDVALLYSQTDEIVNGYII